MAKRIVGDDVARFWSKIEKTDGCWIWTAGVDTGGYGQIRIDGRLVMAHRYAYELIVGPFPAGMLACHTCDNPRCVRPDHVFPGTYADNSADMVSKGRQATGDRHRSRLYPEVVKRGEAHPKAVLTAEIVAEIRNRRAAGEGVRALGREYGISHNTVVALLQRRSWAHVP
jgi:lambda repressor-like predicted transcriptional regulator